MTRPTTLAAEDRVIVGQVSGLYGIRGWVKVFSHTAPKENITTYNPLYLNIKSVWQVRRCDAARAHGKGVVMKFENIDNRDDAAALIGVEIAVGRDQLAPLSPGEFYWSDLQGLTVINRDGERFGTVDYVMATGANDVLVVKGERERLIPFIRDQVVTAVDLRRRELRVDWDADF